MAEHILEWCVVCTEWGCVDVGAGVPSSNNRGSWFNMKMLRPIKIFIVELTFFLLHCLEERMIYFINDLSTEIQSFNTGSWIYQTKTVLNFVTIQMRVNVMATWLMGGTNAHSITNASKFWAGEYWVKNLAGWLEFYIQEIWDICFWVTALEL